MTDQIGSSNSLTICIAQYWRGRGVDGTRMPLHWALFLIADATPESLLKSSSGREYADLEDHWGTCYQAIGNIDTFAYSRTEYEYMEILAEQYRGCLPLSTIDPKRMAEVDVLMKQVAVFRGREDWNCQSWVLQAVEKLKVNGMVPSHLTANGIRNELEDILRRWTSYSAPSLRLSGFVQLENIA